MRAIWGEVTFKQQTAQLRASTFGVICTGARAIIRETKYGMHKYLLMHGSGHTHWYRTEKNELLIQPWRIKLGCDLGASLWPFHVPPVVGPHVLTLMYIIFKLAWVIEMFSRWHEGCPCHGTNYWKDSARVRNALKTKKFCRGVDNDMQGSFIDPD